MWILLLPLFVCHQVITCTETLPQEDHEFYTVNPLNIGAEVSGVSLSNDPSPGMIQQIVKDTYAHKLLVFKGQGQISAERHAEIAHWFGKEVDTNHRQHEKAEHEAVFRVSNDESEGFRNVGNTGWHIDGFFNPHPHTFVLYHMASVAKKGNTDFVNLHEVVKRLSPEQKDIWSRLFIRCKYRTYIVHPLIYIHPVTRLETLCINTYFTEEFILDYNTTAAYKLNSTEKEGILQEISEALEQDTYSHKWEEGDFLMTDNLALAHIADSDTQLPPEDIGLRLLHRVSVVGKTPPLKNPPPHEHAMLFRDKDQSREKLLNDEL